MLLHSGKRNENSWPTFFPTLPNLAHPLCLYMYFHMCVCAYVGIHVMNNFPSFFSPSHFLSQLIADSRRYSEARVQPDQLQCYKALQIKKVRGHPNPRHPQPDSDSPTITLTIFFQPLREATDSKVRYTKGWILSPSWSLLLSAGYRKKRGSRISGLKAWETRSLHSINCRTRKIVLIGKYK